MSGNRMSHVGEGTRAERDRLIHDHLGLARHVARRYSRGTGEREDLTQVAYAALVAAAGRYDPGAGEFGRFAFASIVGEIKRYRRDSGWWIRVPRRVQEAYLEVEQATDHLTQVLGRSPTPREIADQCGLDVEDVVEALHVGSLRSVPEDSADVAGDERTDEIDTRVAVESALADLEDDERGLLGLYYAQNLSQREIGERIGMSQAHVHRRLRSAVDNLRAAMGPTSAGPSDHDRGP